MSYFRAENLSLHFGGLKAVDAVSFAVEKGEILSIIGPNGAGKSSIFNLISRIYSADLGQDLFRGSGHHRKSPPSASPNSASPAPSRTSNCSRMRPCSSTFWSAATAIPPPSSGRNCCSCRACAQAKRRIAAASSR